MLESFLAIAMVDLVADLATQDSRLSRRIADRYRITQRILQMASESEYRLEKMLEEIDQL
jgi:hypothetical protein